MGLEIRSEGFLVSLGEDGSLRSVRSCSPAHPTGVALSAGEEASWRVLQVSLAGLGGPRNHRRDRFQPQLCM